MIPDKAFYLNPGNLNGNSFFLDQQESHHLSEVFRLKLKDQICLLDGLGTGYIGKIKTIENGIVSGAIIKVIKGLGESSFNINIAPAIIKRQRFEMLLEKSTELGIKEIHPVITERCIKKTINLKRCERIIISSAKQCQRSFFPKIHEPIKLESWLKHSKDQFLVGSINATCKLSQLNIEKDKGINILIGPEGDFNKNEMGILSKQGAQFYTLCNRRLRSDTAAQTTISIVNELLYHMG